MPPKLMTAKVSTRTIDAVAMMAILGQKVDDLKEQLVGVKADLASSKVEREASFEKMAFAARTAHAEQKMEIAAIAREITPLRDDINRAKGAAAATKFLVGFALTLWSAAISFATAKFLH